VVKWTDAHNPLQEARAKGEPLPLPPAFLHRIQQGKERGIETKIEVVLDPDVAEAICQAAERLDVDLVLLGSQRRQGLFAEAGSISKKVVAQSRRPVLVLSAPRPPE
jgi:nucleotide-binding universal stress UspA family protein